ncbi:hypothetical protein BU17DRAFT_65128 [Hysterangium stoloniferum]|nr:hypothetical protein BU17DRAFT_65128 [Hysterangium stoloniferum]
MNTLVSVLLLVSLRLVPAHEGNEEKHGYEGVHHLEGCPCYENVESTPGETSASGTLGGLVRVVVGRVLMGIALGKGNGLHATARDIRMWRCAGEGIVLRAFEKLVLGMSVEEAEEVVKSSYGHSQLLPTTTTSVSVPKPTSTPAQRQSPVQHIASYTVGLRTKEIAARPFVECVNIGSGAGVEAVLQAGKGLGSSLADLTRMIEKCAGSIGVGITGVSVASGASPGLGMSATAISPSAYLYLYELTDILEESESECSSEAEEDGVTGVGVEREEAMVRDAKPIMMTTMFYRYIITVSANHNYNRTTGALPAITTARTIPIPAPSCPKPPAAMLLALRRVLGSMEFNFTPDMEDARDRIVDVLADMGRDAGRCPTDG